MRHLIWLLPLLVGCAPPATPTESDVAGDTSITDATWHARADAATASLLLHFWRGSDSYLTATNARDSDAQYWNFAETFESLLDTVERNHGARFAGWPAALAAAQRSRGFSRNWYDDENWMTLALLRAYDLTGDESLLDEAKTLYADIEAGWDTSCCGSAPGGIWWDRAHTQKATAANAGPVIAGVRLAARTGDTSTLAFAQKVYAYWRAHMTDATTGEVFDHELPTGAAVKWNFTYNEALMIGAALALYDATGDAGALADAQRYASFMLAHQTRATASGDVLYDGTNASCGGDCAQFKGIGARFLAALDEAAPSTPVHELLAGSAGAIWNTARASDGRFATDWIEAPTATTLVAAQASAVAGLNAYAARLTPAAPPAAGVYEAEDFTLSGIGLEAAHAGFSGWGYLAGWQGNGQKATFSVERSAAGSATLVFHYAAEESKAAVRTLQVDGKSVGAMTFPSTGSWDKWATAQHTLTLPAGRSTITIAFDGSSASYLNLDRVTLSP